MHETGHMYIFNANRWWYTYCPEHSVFDLPSEVNCAWSEGWADFLPLAVNNDQCYNLNTVNPCQGGIADQDYFNLEAHNRADNDPSRFKWGDSVEGRVAGALYDLYDSNNEDWDRIYAGFFPIANIALGGSQITTFQTFWDYWRIYSYQDLLPSGLTTWWNTIDYLNIRFVYLPNIRK